MCLFVLYRSNKRDWETCDEKCPSKLVKSECPMVINVRHYVVK